MLRSQNPLELQQQVISPRAEVITVPGVQLLRTFAVQQIAAQVEFAICSPLGVGRWQAGDSQASAYPAKHIVKLALLLCVEGPSQQLMRPLGVVDEHVEHVAVGPIRNRLSALTLDCPVNRSDPFERAGGGGFIGKNDVLSVARGGEESADGIGRQLPSEEQPIDRTVECELGGAAGEDEEHRIGIAPDLPYY